MRVGAHLFRLAFRSSLAVRAALPPWVRVAVRPLKKTAAAQRVASAARALRPTTFPVGGHLLELDASDSLALSLNPVYEPLLTRRLETELGPGTTFVDVGANIGYFTLLAARTVGPEGLVLAFEPEPETAAILRRNIARNGYTNIIEHEFALGETEGAATIYSHESNMGAHTLHPRWPHARATKVETARLDSFFDVVPEHLVLKIDVEGSEGAVVAGMTRLLDECDDLTLIVEYLPDGLKAAGADPAAFLAALRDRFAQIDVIDELAGTTSVLTERDAPAMSGILVTLVCSGRRSA